jgi:hypothetical protein
LVRATHERLVLVLASGSRGGFRRAFLAPESAILVPRGADLADQTSMVLWILRDYRGNCVIYRATNVPAGPSQAGNCLY